MSIATYAECDRQDCHTKDLVNPGLLGTPLPDGWWSVANPGGSRWTFCSLGCLSAETKSWFATAFNHEPTS